MFKASFVPILLRPIIDIRFKRRRDATRMKSFLSQHEFARQADADWRSVLKLVATGIIKPVGRVNRDKLIFSPNDVKAAKLALRATRQETTATP